jgi:hypothetical protein
LREERKLRKFKNRLFRNIFRKRGINEFGSLGDEVTRNFVRYGPVVNSRVAQMRETRNTYRVFIWKTLGNGHTEYRGRA